MPGLALAESALAKKVLAMWLPYMKMFFLRECPWKKITSPALAR